MSNKTIFKNNGTVLNGVEHKTTYRHVEKIYLTMTEWHEMTVSYKYLFGSQVLLSDIHLKRS